MKLSGTAGLNDRSMTATFDVSDFQGNFLRRVFKCLNPMKPGNFGINWCMLMKSVIIMSVEDDFDSNGQIGRSKRKSSDLIRLNRCSNLPVT